MMRPPPAQAGSRTPWPLLLAAALMLGYLVVPLLALLHALPETTSASLTGPDTLDALQVSLIAAVTATMIDALLGIPLGFYLAHTRSRWRHLVTAAVVLPLAVPPIVGGLELILVVGRATAFGGLLERFGINPLDTIAGTILAQAFVAAPFVVISARAAFASVDPQLSDAAHVLGTSPWQTFWRVQLPVARRGLAAGVVLGFMRCLGDFGATAILAYHPYTLPTLIFVNVSGEGIPTAIPPAVLVATVGVVAGGVMLFLDARRRWPHSTTSEPPTAAVLADLSWIRPDPAAGSGIEIELHAQVGDFELHPVIRTAASTIGILGPSGSGKSLTMRAVAGLLPAAGTVRVGLLTLTNTRAGLAVAAQNRQLGYVAQKDALFEHLDVAGNITFGIRHLPAAERDRRLRELLAAVGLTHLRRARPARLSGGERQRIALARALAPGPRALLLDESFANLDTTVRTKLRTLVRHLHERTGIPIIVVTHDRDDVLDIADHLVVMSRGTSIQQGPTRDVFRHPATRISAQLVGVPNILTVHQLHPHTDGNILAVTDWGTLLLPSYLNPHGCHELAVPATAITVAGTGTAAMVEASRPALHGHRLVLRPIRPSPETLTVLLAPANDAPPAPGDRIHIHINPGYCQPLSPATTSTPAQRAASMPPTAQLSQRGDTRGTRKPART
jgi:ABC-type sulfate/molybdate transport systems ATPase subunit/ABC-type sulfate transport system permease component